MEIIGDLQIHSRFSRACSKDITLDNLEKYARIKGLNLLGTGDFQHPKWNKEIKENLSEDENGILWSKNKFPFLWQTEISLMYKDVKRRAVHLLVFSPNKEVADQIIDVLGKRGRLDYDGRPIFGIPSVEFVEMMKEIDDKVEVIPAHCMTSFFGVFGSKSGFDSLKDCFKDKVNKIYAIESGMSCYDKKTEILTKQGWKKVYEVKRLDEICTLNVETNYVEYQKPTKIFMYNYNGKMYKLKTRRVDLLVTPNHKLLISNCNFRKKPHFFLREAELLFNKSKRFKKSGRWFGRNVKFFALPTVKIKHGSRYYSGFRNKKEKKLPIMSWLRFFGFWLAEGWTTRIKSDYGVYLCNKNKSLILEIKKILTGFGYNVYYYKNRGIFNIRVRDYQLFNYLNQFGKSNTKFIPKEIKGLTKQLLEVFFEYYVKGDGHIYGRTMKGISATTNSINLRNDLQEIALKMGLSAYYKLGRKKGTPLSSLGKPHYKSRFDTWQIYFIRENIHTVMPSIIKKFGYIESWVDFNGKVYCVSVPNKVVYVRRNGIPVWCGNSDPQMLWRLKENVNIVSFSDAHSFWPYRIGREATLFDLKELSYDNVIKAIRIGEGLKGTVEVFPEYGKYHIDGHRNCGFSCDYIESKKLNKICPKCGKEMTIGVEYRIEELAKEKKGFKPNNTKEIIEVIPLQEVIASVLDAKQLNSKKVLEIYNKLIKEFKNEFNILLNTSYDDLIKIVHEKIAKVIIKNREGRLNIKPGFDGVYGQIILDKEEKIKEQKSLGEF